MSLIGYLTFTASKTELLQHISEKLQLINDLKKEKIDDYFAKIKTSFEFLESSKELHISLEELVQRSEKGIISLTQSDSIHKKLLYENLWTIKESYGFNRITLLNLNGKVIYTTNEVPHLKNFDNELFTNENSTFINARSSIVFSDIYQPLYRSDEFYIMALAPLKNKSNKTVAIIAAESSVKPIYNILTDSTGLGKTGESYITMKKKNKILFLSPLKFQPNSILNFEIKVGEPYSVPAQKSTMGHGHGFATEILDYDKNLVDAAWSYIPELNWGIVTKIEHEDSFKSIIFLRVLITFLCCSIIFFAIVFIAIFVKKFLQPFLDIRDNMILLSYGYFPEKVVYENDDEIKETTDAMNNLVERLIHSTEFAQKIGKGDLNAHFDYEKGEDVLSKALLSMRDSLALIEIENEKRKWTTEGIALHAEIIRKNNESLEKTCHAFLASLVHYIGAQQGGIYTINRITDSTTNSFERKSSVFELTASFAYDLSEVRKILTNYQLGQGLIGQCALEKEIIYIKNHPTDFSHVSSGLGNADAMFVVFAPLMVNQEVLGVIEIASFEELESHKINFIEKVSEGIASAILSAKTSEHTIILLEESQKITEILKKKEFELVDQQTKLQLEIEKLQEENKFAFDLLEKLKNKQNKDDKNNES